MQPSLSTQQPHPPPLNTTPPFAQTYTATNCIAHTQSAELFTTLFNTWGVLQPPTCAASDQVLGSSEGKGGISVEK